MLLAFLYNCLKHLQNFPARHAFNHLNYETVNWVVTFGSEKHNVSINYSCEDIPFTKKQQLSSTFLLEALMAVDSLIGSSFPFFTVGGSFPALIATLACILPTILNKKDKSCGKDKDLSQAPTSKYSEPKW